jgi:hypothetical protein
MQQTLIHGVVLAALAALVIAVLTRYAPFYAPSYLFWAGVILMVAGLASLVHPLRFLLIRTRRVATIAVLAGAAVSVCALFCPFRLVHADQRSALDRLMPDYHFREVHSVRVQASPALALRAMDEVTLEDLRVYRILMGARQLAVGRVPHFTGMERPLMATLTSGPFPQLAEEPGREVVLGGPVEFPGGKVMAVINVRAEDAGGGWTRLSTETRILGPNEVDARSFAHYWRMIYPGSAIIRQMWLNAAVSRIGRATRRR